MSLVILPDGSEIVRYRDPSLPIDIVRADLTPFPNYAFLCHWHEDIELLIPLKGHLNYNVNGQVFCLEAGDAIWINSRQLHYGYSIDGTNCEYICICFRPDLLCSSEEIRNRYVLPVLTDHTLPHLVFRASNPAHGPILDLLREIWEVREKNMTALGKLFELWQMILELTNQSDREPVGQDTAILRKMLECIRTQYANRLVLADIAAAGGICRSKCCQIFKEQMRTSPNEYLASYRLERAAELLRESKLSITEIANACGFGSSSYFAESFGKQKGCTPSEYRRKYNHGFKADRLSPS